MVLIQQFDIRIDLIVVSFAQFYAAQSFIRKCFEPSWDIHPSISKVHFQKLLA